MTAVGDKHAIIGSCYWQGTQYISPPSAVSPTAHPAAPMPWQDQDEEKDDLEKDDGATWRDGDARRRQPRVSIVATGGAHLPPIRWDDDIAPSQAPNNHPASHVNFLLWSIYAQGV